MHDWLGIKVFDVGDMVKVKTRTNGEDDYGVVTSTSQTGGQWSYFLRCLVGVDSWYLGWELEEFVNV
jgi:hypothetical protein